MSTNKQAGMKVKAASISEAAFCCPHCGAYTAQTWYHLYSEQISENGIPQIPDGEMRRSIERNQELDEEVRAKLLSWIDRMSQGMLFFEEQKERELLDTLVHNLHLSSCYVCNEIAVWVHDRIVYPATRTGATPAEDMPEECRIIFEEARSIVDLSPKGAAALLSRNDAVEKEPPMGK